MSNLMTYPYVSTGHNFVWLVCYSDAIYFNDAFLVTYLLAIYHNTSSPYVWPVICYTWLSTTARWSDLITIIDPFVQVPVPLNRITIETSFEPCIGSKFRVDTAENLLLSNHSTYLFKDLLEGLIHDLLQVWFFLYVLMTSMVNNKTFELYTNQRHGL